MGHRERLLSAARRLLEDKGYAHITARDLVAASDTNLASIGYHFGSKAGLLNAALGAAVEEWSTQLAQAAMADPTASPIARAHQTWAALLDSMASKRALVVSFVEALAQADRDPRLREQLAMLRRGTLAKVSVLVATSIGAEPTDPKCMALASYVLAVCDGLAMQWMLDPTSTPRSADLVRGLTDLLRGSGIDPSA